MNVQKFYHSKALAQEDLSAMFAAILEDEGSIMQKICAAHQADSMTSADAQQATIRLVEKIRRSYKPAGPIEAMLLEYDLSTEEGIALMCLGEALMRVPDKHTQDLLIKEKLTTSDWQKASGKSGMMVANAASWGLMLGGKILDDKNTKNLWAVLQKMISKLGEPVIRRAVRQVLEQLANQFILGRDIQEAMTFAQKLSKKGYRFSFDMLGEAALTDNDAQKFYEAYVDAIKHLAHPVNQKLTEVNSVSVKLSALCPFYDSMHAEEAVSALTEKVINLVKLAKAHHVALCIDAEENSRLGMSLEIFKRVILSDHCADWKGFGLAIQAYHKGAVEQIKWLSELLRSEQRFAQVRLVKGAYWDTEIKLAQQAGLDSYPVFTRKENTDCSYLYCAKLMLDAQDVIFPQFATHNAYTVMMILNWGRNKHYEFQCLQGMGGALYDTLLLEEAGVVNVRMYAPVGIYEDLLPYLVRRILENGANSSFVNQLIDNSIPSQSLAEDPFIKVTHEALGGNPKIALPKDLFGAERLNSRGYQLANDLVKERITTALNVKNITHDVRPITPVDLQLEDPRVICSPHQHDQVLGRLFLAKPEMVDQVMQVAKDKQAAWGHVSVGERADILNKCADLLVENEADLLRVVILEAGKTLQDAIDELREAVDFLRYYAQMALQLEMQALPGPTGEENKLFYIPTGPTFCISPWNFPIAIFVGQVAAALAAGNTVIAKPATQTSLCAALTTQLFFKAGIPEGVLQLIPCAREVASGINNHPLLRQVILTGSTQTAQLISKTLAERPGPIIPLVAETGGLNVMMVDSSALPEQVVTDLIVSAFQSAGQRCSACRIVCIQEDIADKIIPMLLGAMAHVVVGDPQDYATHIGPVIDQAAIDRLQKHINYLDQVATCLYAHPTPQGLAKDGYFFMPRIYQIEDMAHLEQEVFGPILHVVTYKKSELPQVLQKIENAGFGLTLGIHSRVDGFIDQVLDNTNVGNNYVNRNMIGAVVGVQPFGGMGLSGTGPKAGGPNYVKRLCKERTVTVNSAAIGGNVSLVIGS